MERHIRLLNNAYHLSLFLQLIIHAGKVSAEDFCVCNPCENNGMCASTPSPTQCECGEGCENGGHCSPNEHDDYRCYCQPGYHGDRCELLSSATPAGTEDLPKSTNKVTTQRRYITTRPATTTIESVYPRSSSTDSESQSEETGTDPFPEDGTSMTPSSSLHPSVDMATRSSSPVLPTDAWTSPHYPGQTISTPVPGHGNGRKQRSQTGATIGAVMAVIVLLVLLVILYLLFRKRRLKSSAMNSGVALQNLAYDTTLSSVEVPVLVSPSYNNDGRVSGEAFHHTLEPDTGESSYTELEKVPKREYQSLTTTTSKKTPNQLEHRNKSEGALQQHSVSGFVENIAYEGGEPSLAQNTIQAEDHGFKTNIAYESFDQAADNSPPRDGITSGEVAKEGEGFVENIAYEGGEPLRSNGGNDIEDDKITENADYETFD